MGNQTVSKSSSKAKKQFQQTYMCPISLQLMKNPYALPCQHTFQYLNLKQHFQKHNSCPICRKSYKFSDARPNILAKQSLQIYGNQIKNKHQQQKQSIQKQSIQKNNPSVKLHHPGYVQSCHLNSIQPKQRQFYLSQQFSIFGPFRCPLSFVNNLSNRGYIPCGDSGNRVFHNNQNYYYDVNQKQQKYACAFVFGTSCKEDILRRRWTCCQRQITGTWQDISKIRGCKRQ